MTLRKSLFALCLASSTACITVGHAMIGAWLGACLTLLPCVLAAFYRKLSAAWVPSFFLACAVSIAAAGLLLRAPAFMMIAGSALALGSWDLANMERSMKGSGDASAALSHDVGRDPAADRQEQKSDTAAPRHEWRHFNSLAIALGAGLFAAAGALVLPLRLPFLVLFLLVILDLFCLERLVRLWRPGGFDEPPSRPSSFP